MAKFRVKDIITNFNGDNWKIIFITNKSYEIELLQYSEIKRILDIDYVEKKFILRNGVEKFDKYENIIKKDLK